MDVSPLYAAADRMDKVAGDLRGRAALIASGAAATRWYSPAARRYFVRIHDITSQLAGCAARLDVLADEVRGHALRVLAAGP